LRRAPARRAARGAIRVVLAGTISAPPWSLKDMTFRAPPKPTDERARATEELIREKGTDTERWARLESLATQWDARAAMAAEWIAAGSSVLDVGAGAMALEKALSPGCTYQPA